MSVNRDVLSCAALLFKYLPGYYLPCLNCRNVLSSGISELHVSLKVISYSSRPW